MSRKRNEFGSNGDAMLASLMTAGKSAAEVAAAMTAAGIKGASRSTVGDRMRELRGQVGSSRAATVRAAKGLSPGQSPPAAPSSSDATEGEPALQASHHEAVEAVRMVERLLARAEAANDISLVATILEGIANLVSTRGGDAAGVPKLDAWIAKAEETITKAEAVGNLPMVGQMLRVAASLAETRRKATPPAKVDPNEQPDMVKLGAQVAERLHKMIDLVCEESRQG